MPTAASHSPAAATVSTAIQSPGSSSPGVLQSFSSPPTGSRTHSAISAALQLDLTLGSPAVLLASLALAPVQKSWEWADSSCLTLVWIAACTASPWYRCFPSQVGASVAARWIGSTQCIALMCSPAKDDPVPGLDPGPGDPATATATATSGMDVGVSSLAPTAPATGTSGPADSCMAFPSDSSCTALGLEMACSAAASPPTA